MIKIQVPYGNGYQEAELPDDLRAAGEIAENVHQLRTVLLP